MFSRKVAALAALSLLVASSPSVAQGAPDPAPPPAQSGNPLGEHDAFTRTGLFLMLAAIVGAVLATVLATQLGGDSKPASP